MPKEYELKYRNFNKEKIIKKLKKLNGTRIHKAITYEYTIFEHPLNIDNTYVRLRKEGDKITFTYKTNTNELYVNEQEVVVSNYNVMLDMLYALGFKKMYSIQKLREKWSIGSCKEIVFDTYPGAMPYMEIECNSPEAIHKLAKKLNLENEDPFTIGDIYYENYGIEKPTKQSKLEDLTFESAEKVLKNKIKKNKDTFNEIIKLQKKYINSLNN